MSIFAKGSEASFVFAISGAPDVEVVGFHAREHLSEPFFVEVSLACPEQIQFDDALQKEARLTIREQAADRYFSGIVRKFQHTGKSGLKYLFTAEIVPFTQLLSLEQDCRIFQNLHVQDIVETIIKDSGVSSDRYDFRLINKDHKRRFCVQYRETDLDFIDRILQEEGIFYFYEHHRDKHIMVFTDDPVGYKPIEGHDTIAFKTESGLNPEKEVISRIDFSHQVRTGTYTHTSYNFKHPSTPLETKEVSRDEKIQKYEHYDFPGQFGETDRGKRLAKVHLEGQTALSEQAEGESNCPRLMVGHTFKLENHDFSDFNKEYLLIEVNHTGRQPHTLEEQAGAAGRTSKYQSEKL